MKKQLTTKQYLKVNNRLPDPIEPPKPDPEGDPLPPDPTHPKP